MPLVVALLLAGSSARPLPASPATSPQNGAAPAPGDAPSSSLHAANASLTDGGFSSFTPAAANGSLNVHGGRSLGQTSGWGDGRCTWCAAAQQR